MLRIEYFDKNRFMKQVAASRGSVILHLDNGSTCDLKKDNEASAIFQTLDAPKKGFSISVSDPADVTGFLRYMLEAGRWQIFRACRNIATYSDTVRRLCATGRKKQVSIIELHGRIILYLPLTGTLIPSRSLEKSPFLLSSMADEKN